MTKTAPPPASAAASASPPEAPRKSSRRRFHILLVLCLVGAVVLKLSFIFLFIGMMPAMVAYVIDLDKHKYICSTVAALNFAGVFPDMMNIYNAGSTFDVVKDKLIDPFIWLIMYGAAAVGWAVVWVSPLIAAMFLEGLYRARILHLEGIQKKMEDEWGPGLSRKGGN
jgi:hypothetical protein